MRVLRKDQVYFVNKRQDGSSELYSLFDFKDFRENMDLEKAYMQGRFDAIPYIDVVEECLCFGWIDSTCKVMPDGRLAQRLSPRRKGSRWTELNKQRCADLERRGLMTDAGRKALGLAVPHPSGKQ